MIPGIMGLALVTLWVAISNENLVSRAPSRIEQQLSAAERRAQALRTGGLKEAAKVTGEFITEIPGSDWGGPATISELVQWSTLIVIGRTESNRSRLDADGNDIRSAYQFDVESVLKGEHQGPKVTVVLLGGRVVFDDGSIAELRVAKAERPVQGERYFLFLRPPKGRLSATGATAYEPGELVPLWDTQGLYRLPGGGARVAPAHLRGRDLAKEIQAMQPGQFIEAVQRAIRTGR